MSDGATNGKADVDRDGAATAPVLTTRQGHPVSDNQNTRTVGERGPATLENDHFIEKITHFDLRTRPSLHRRFRSERTPVMDESRFPTVFRSRSTRDSRRNLLHRTAILAPSLALLVALLLAGPALAAVRTGTPGADTLVGTTKNDQITGNGGNDTLKGKAGNDRYIFADNWGTDTLIEKRGEGSDTVDFRAVTTGRVSVALFPEWVDVDPTFNYNGATGPGGEVHFRYNVNGQVVQSVVENVIGGQGEPDIIQGGAGKNIYQPGGGALDYLADGGGYDDGPDGNPELPVSNDIYKGFATNTGTDIIVDFGGNGDVLDLRPYATGEVFATAIDFDRDSSATTESLQIVTGFTGQIIILGHFGDFANNAARSNLHGHIETIRFADKTFSSTSALQSMTVASAETLSGKQARLAEAAAGLAKEARTLIDPNDPLGVSKESRAERKRR